LDDVVGCAFRERCSQAFDQCERSVARRDVTAGHMVECNLSADVNTLGACA
jgi:hypothetical protein